MLAMRKQDPYLTAINGGDMLASAVVTFHVEHLGLLCYKAQEYTN